VNKRIFKVINYKELRFNDFGDRVAQLLHVESFGPFSQNGNGDENIQQEILIVNTHLLFPHDRTLSIVRLKQVNNYMKAIKFYYAYFFRGWLIVNFYEHCTHHLHLDEVSMLTW
jgi:hypothetical protein